MGDDLDEETLALMTKAVKDAHEKALLIGPVLIAQEEGLYNYLMVIDKHGNK